MTAKKKYRLLRWLLTPVTLVVNTFLVTALFVALGASEAWANVEKSGISLSLESFPVWFSLVLYGLLLYLLPALILSSIRFDRRFKWASRFCICLNWTFCIWIVIKASVVVFALDRINGFPTFGNRLNPFVVLSGYLITLARKKPISFDSTGAIIDKTSYESKEAKPIKPHRSRTETPPEDTVKP